MSSKYLFNIKVLCPGRMRDFVPKPALPTIKGKKVPQS